MRGLFFTVIGAALLIAAVIATIGVQRFRDAAARADGVVERLNAGGSHPQIRFTTTAGDVVSYAQGGLIFGYRAGDRVRVMYRPDRPQATARLDQFGAMWAMPLLLGLLGAGFPIGGMLHFLATRAR
ncbi:DUF3592 domain-containing protein [Sphingomonas sp. CFBP 8760]|uniref:DUF3592 domain-containing protein n=1 Tax=Sphingomonas sp. CFBP 8760 TaxID=2775282 RepID=UPI00177B4CBD|nr:DUF3592 domain-containing protein [Sphingomonas sp. CFBP 8760]MBD8547618.1 DUF3592 domain-containing protein [Sphingomonas sp. CFBP 8760]